MDAKIKTNNRLWQARHKRGLEQKQVAYLLGHKTINQISRYENGTKTPSLRTALKLELILHMPVSDLFPDHYQQCRAEIAERLAQDALPETSGNGIKYLKDAHLCTYANALLQKKPTKAETDSARTHSIALTFRLSDVINKRQYRD